MRWRRKDMIILAKVFCEDIDGEFDYPEDHKWNKLYGRRYDRKYLIYRLKDEIRMKSNNDHSFYKSATELDNVYIVYTGVKIGTKLEEVLREMGFSEIKIKEA